MADILIVDDEQSYRQLLSLVFEGDGHGVRTAKNGKEAIDLLNESPADVVISDVRMPDMDGISMLREARKLFPDIGVVLMTAFATVDTAREAFILRCRRLHSKTIRRRRTEAHRQEDARDTGTR